jgi:hypothetical protein
LAILPEEESMKEIGDMTLIEMLRSLTRIRNAVSEIMKVGFKSFPVSENELKFQITAEIVAAGQTLKDTLDQIIKVMEDTRLVSKGTITYQELMGDGTTLFSRRVRRIMSQFNPTVINDFLKKFGLD